MSDGTSLADVVKQFKPTCLLGLAAQPAGLFTEEMVSAMIDYTDVPIVRQQHLAPAPGRKKRKPMAAARILDPQRTRELQSRHN